MAASGVTPPPYCTSTPFSRIRVKMFSVISSSIFTSFSFGIKKVVFSRKISFM
jgi:hypothetical protein